MSRDASAVGALSFAVLAFALVAPPAAGAAAAPTMAAQEDAGHREADARSLPDTVRIEEPGLHPEGIEWDEARGRFLVSSVTRGTVTAVGDDGSLETLVAGTDLAGAIGIHLDTATDRLLVASADLSVFSDTATPGVARMGIYDAGTGEPRRVVELGELAPEGRHFGNDLAAGPDGSVYVTDSFSPVIYRVAPDGSASVFVRDERLGGSPFGLNGIDVHPEGFLLVAMAGDRALFRVPLDAPEEMAEVVLEEPFAADGLILRPDGALVAVASIEDGSEVLLVRSDDGWRSARIAARAPAAAATTATLRDGEVYVVDPHFEGLGGEDPVPAFEVFRVELTEDASR